MRQRFVTTFAELTAAPPRHLLLLYSGGVDGTYLLWKLGRLGIRTTALNVRIGTGSDGETGEKHAGALSAGFREVDATDEYFADFLPPAIHADAYYQGQFPVGSSLTRPLMAKVAVEVARQSGCDAIGHTATYMQNSAVRLSRSVAALAPDLHVVAPFLGSDVPRDAKLSTLGERGFSFPAGIHSIDVNPWARVIECGSLESPENLLDESVFTWTRASSLCPQEPAEVEVTFRAGLPVALDGTELGLAEVVNRLNDLGGTHGVGRFAGLEDTPFGVKNHEIRESPAAAVITTAHRALANGVLGTREHTVRATLAQEWTNIAVHGGWFSHLGQALGRCLADLDRLLDGTVRLRLHRGAVTLCRLRSDNGLYYSRLGESFHALMNDVAYAPWLTLETLADDVRSGQQA